MGEGRRLRKTVFRAFYFGNAGGYVGGAESCVECALWTASGNPSVVNHPSLPIHFLDRVEERCTIEKLAPRNSHLACALHSRKLDEFRKKNEIKSHFSLYDKFSKRFLKEIFQSIIFSQFLKTILKISGQFGGSYSGKIFLFFQHGRAWLSDIVDLGYLDICPTLTTWSFLTGHPLSTPRRAHVTGIGLRRSTSRVFLEEEHLPCPVICHRKCTHVVLT